MNNGDPWNKHPLTEKEIQTLLMIRSLRANNHTIAIANTRSIFDYEADLLSVTRAGLIHEFEIKRTQADFNADFKKPKHDIMQRIRTHKTKRLFSAIPAYFWFVCCGFEPAFVPDYAGLILIRSDKNQYSSLAYSWRETIFAPRLHTHKITTKQKAMLARLLSIRVLNYHETIHDVTKDTSKEIIHD